MPDPPPELVVGVVPVVPVGLEVSETVVPLVLVELVGVAEVVFPVVVPLGFVVLVGVVVVFVGVVVVPVGVVVPLGVVVLATTWVKFAVQDLSLVIVTCPLTQSPLQLLNSQPVAGVAESVTGVSCPYVCVQLLPHPPSVP